MAEHLICNQKVVGSNPTAGSKGEERDEIMRYLLDIVLVAALAWIGWLWNAEKNAALAQADEIDRLKAQAAQLVLELKPLKDRAPKAAEELAAAKESLAQTEKDLQDRTAALESMTLEAEALRTSEAALKTRVDELQYYRDQAQKAVMEEKPAPVPAPAAP